jgi:hypothetical protein
LTTDLILIRDDHCDCPESEASKYADIDMDPGKPVVVATFSDRWEAELVAGLLESAGIRAFVLSDDAGGFYPALASARGVQVVVREDDLAAATAVLEDVSTGTDDGPPNGQV